MISMVTFRFFSVRTDMNIRQAALIACQCDVDVIYIILNDCLAGDRNTEVFCLHFDPVSISPDRNDTVHSFFVPFLPVIPAGKSPGVIDLKCVFSMGIRFPVLSIQTKKHKLLILFSVHPSIL